ncbi:MAG TPA: LacI family DNA-binding transcriptional regulator [Tepidisphaeraceae bacterium]
MTRDISDERADTSIRPPRRATRIHDVAKLAGVSVATVSMVMNDSPRISRPTAARVRAAADRLGYHPSRAARALRGMKSRTLAVFVPPSPQGMADLCLGDLLNGVREAAQHAGYRLLLEHSPSNHDSASRAGFDAEEVEGILCVGCTVADVPHEMLDLPLMLLDSRPTRCSIDHITCDYSGAVAQAVKHIADLGHSQIALVRPAGADHREFEMLVGFRQAMNERGISSSTVLAQAHRTEAGGSEAAADLLDRHPDLTAVIVADDRMAIGLLHQLHLRGLDCPRELSIVAIGDFGPAAYATPAISSVSVPLFEVGRLGAEKFIQRLRGETGLIKVSLPAHLVPRASTGPARLCDADHRQRRS